MKILFLHPYGKLGDWNFRLKKQIEMMSKHFELVVESVKPTELGFENKDNDFIRKRIKEEKPNLIYVNSFYYETAIRDCNVPYIYDMGSFLSRNILINQYGYDVKEMLAIPDKELIWKLENCKMSDYYRKEKAVLEKAKAITTWGSEEDILMQKIFGNGVYSKIKPILTNFTEFPPLISFQDKKPLILAITPKWGDKEKNLSLLNDIRKEIDIKVIGNSGDESFVEHTELMKKLNDARVLFCPYKAGGCGTVVEGLKLGCNVVTMEYYPFNNCINEELIANKKNVVEILKKALVNYYPPKNIPIEQNHLENLIKLCQSSTT